LLSIKFTAFSILAALAVISLLSGSLGMIATVTRNTLPGDALFPLKVKLEHARLKSADDSIAQANLYLQFGGRRLSEIRYLLDQGRYADVALATSEFTRNIQRTLVIVRAQSNVDPGQASVLNSEVLFLLREYNEILTSNLAIIPANMQPTVVLWESALPSPAVVANDNDGIDVPGPFPTMTAMPLILPASTPTSLPASLP
jgi:hypothetical protein